MMICRRIHLFAIIIFLRTSIALLDESLLHAVVDVDNIPEHNDSKPVPDFEGENALLEVLGADDIEENQVRPHSDAVPFDDVGPI